MQDIRQVKDKVIQIALAMAADKNWSDITLYAIARQAGFDLSDVEVLFPEKNDILMAYGRQIDRDLSDEFASNNDGGHADGETARDRLFDVMMARFDHLNGNRAAMMSILNSVSMDPKAAIMALPFVYRSVSCMMELAGMDVNGLRGTAQAAMISALYLKTLRVWVADDTVDMAATMASLDKALEWAEKMQKGVCNRS